MWFEALDVKIQRDKLINTTLNVRSPCLGNVPFGDFT
jgi:hypothetical protein